MKKLVISTILASTLLNATGIPVVDAAANAQIAAQNMKTLAEYAERAKRWTDTVIHYRQQIQSYKNELESKTGIRDTVQFVKDVRKFNQFAKRYGSDFLKLSDDILNDNSLLSIEARRLYDKYNIFDECRDKEFLEKSICQNKLARKTKELVVYEKFGKQIDEITDNVNELSVKLANSGDIKESNDINNAISAQMAKLELTKTQIELMNAQNIRQEQIEKAQEEKLRYQRRHKKDNTDYSKYLIK